MQLHVQTQSISSGNYTTWDMHGQDTKAWKTADAVACSYQNEKCVSYPYIMSIFHIYLYVFHVCMMHVTRKNNLPCLGASSQRRLVSDT